MDVDEVPEDIIQQDPLGLLHIAVAENAQAAGQALIMIGAAVDLLIQKGILDEKEFNDHLAAVTAVADKEKAKKTEALKKRMGLG